MKLMVDISSGSGEELPSAAVPVAAPAHPMLHAPASCPWRMGPPNRAPGPAEVPRALQLRGWFGGRARKPTRHHGCRRRGRRGTPSVVLGRPSLGDGAYWGFSPKTRGDAEGQNSSRAAPPCPKHLPPPLSVSLVTAPMTMAVSSEKPQGLGSNHCSFLQADVLLILKKSK